MKLKRRLVVLHRWASLAVLALWTLEALTGLFCVFHWEIDDATVAGATRPLDLDALERSAAKLAPPGSPRHVASIWSSAGGRDRFDVNIAADAPAIGSTVRVDGAGNVLRVRPDDERWREGGLADAIVQLHQSLLQGAAGKPFIGVSGLLLASNLIMGFAVAWPKRGQWRRALLPGWMSPGPGRLLAWHRAVGLWLGGPLVFLALFGCMLAFEGTIERWTGATPLDAPVAPQRPAGARPTLGAAAATRAALARFPGAEVSGIDYPGEDAIWEIRLKQPAEPRRAYGKTRVWVDGFDGRVLKTHDALAARPARAFVDILFSLHTGEAAGLPGRLLVFLEGLTLLTLIVLGLRLWLARRRLRATRERSAVRQPAPV